MEFELDASTVAAMPCPPLPVLVTGADSQEEKAFPSHTIMKSILHRMSQRTDDSEKIDYTVRLKAIAETLFATIDTQGEHITTQQAYEAFCTYMRQVLLASRPVHPDIRFLPLEHTCKGDTMHKATCDHMRAQDFLFGEQDPCSIVLYEEMEYSDLVVLYTQRILSGK